MSDPSATGNQDGVFQGALDVPLDLPLASGGTRAMAQAIDLFALSFLVALLWAVTIGGALAASMSQLIDPDVAVITAIVVSLVGMFLAQWFYFVGCELGMDGQSPGKVVMGLRVVTRDGATVGAVPSLIRNLLRIIDLLPGAYGVGLIAMWLSPSAQRLGDLAAGTVVVREPPDRKAAPTVGRWPDGMAQADRQVILDWLRRIPELDYEHRSALAEGLVAWLDKGWPGFLLAGGEGPPEARLKAALEVQDPGGRGAA